MIVSRKKYDEAVKALAAANSSNENLEGHLKRSCKANHLLRDEIEAARGDKWFLIKRAEKAEAALAAKDDLILEIQAELQEHRNREAKRMAGLERATKASAAKRRGNLSIVKTAEATQHVRAVA